MNRGFNIAAVIGIIAVLGVFLAVASGGQVIFIPGLLFIILAFSNFSLANHLKRFLS